jgi:acetyltransferase-like isoleucine patch superfamily enzyme
VTLRLDPRGPNLFVGDDVELGEDVVLGANVVLHDGVRIGPGCNLGDGAVLGKRPALGGRSTASRDPLPGLVLGAGCTVSTHAVVFAGTTIGDGSIVGDLALVRERCTIGSRVVIGRGATVENGTIVGDRTKIQAEAYITAYCTLEEDVFVAPCVVTTNDNYMGRTQKRFAEVGGPTIRRGARIGGGAILLPGIEIGEEAFVGAGALVRHDVPPRTVVVGAPARVLREVPAEQLLEAGGHEKRASS